MGTTAGRVRNNNLDASYYSVTGTPSSPIWVIKGTDGKPSFGVFYIYNSESYAYDGTTLVQSVPDPIQKIAFTSSTGWTGSTGDKKIRLTQNVTSSEAYGVQVFKEEQSGYYKTVFVDVEVDYNIRNKRSLHCLRYRIYWVCGNYKN